MPAGEALGTVDCNACFWVRFQVLQEPLNSLNFAEFCGILNRWNLLKFCLDVCLLEERNIVLE